MRIACVKERRTGGSSGGFDSAREKGEAMKTCEKCGVELDKTEMFIGHTPERCRDRLAARLNAQDEYVRALEAVAEASTDYLESGPMGDTLLRHKYHLMLAARERLGAK